MSYESIEITPVTPRIGAMVAGVTLAKPLSNRESGTGQELSCAAQQNRRLFNDRPWQAV